MESEESLLKMAEALKRVESLTADEEKFLERIEGMFREERRLTKKDKTMLLEMYKEHIGEDKTSEEDPNEVDEDDFA